MARRSVDAFCSFCHQAPAAGAKLVAGPGVAICDPCVKRCTAILKGKKAASFTGWRSVTDDGLLEGLRPAAAISSAVDASLREQVAELRDRGVSWERIGRALGVTRQAAQQRFH